MGAPKFPRGRLKHKIPIMPKDKFVVAIWTNFNCTEVSKPMTMHEAFSVYRGKVNETRFDQVVGVLDHKRRTVVRDWGNQQAARASQRAQLVQ